MAKHLAVLVAVAATALSGCDGGNDSSSPSSSPSTTISSTSTSPAPSTPASATPSRIVVKGRTAVDLTKVLLELRDMPPGFAVVPDRGTNNSTVNSNDRRCLPLLTMMSSHTPGAKAHVHRKFSGARQGPLIDESLDAMGSAKAVADRLASFRAAVSTCHSVTVRIPGKGTSRVGVREISPPRHGTGPVAIRLSGTGGPLDGVEINLVTTAVDDVLVGMDFVGAAPGDVDGATRVAVAKATDLLAGKSGT